LLLRLHLLLSLRLHLLRLDLIPRLYEHRFALRLGCSELLFALYFGELLCLLLDKIGLCLKAEVSWLQERAATNHTRVREVKIKGGPLNIVGHLEWFEADRYYGNVQERAHTVPDELNQPKHVLAVSQELIF
jgi:hypothetical protein